MSSNAARSRGLPHSSYSPVVRGMESSRHGRQHVDERDLGDLTPAKRSGRRLRTRAHQQPAGAAAHGVEPLGPRVAPSRTRCSAQAMKSVERVALAAQPALVVPPPAQLLSPPRTCAIANRNPRSSRLSRAELNAGVHRDPVGPRYTVQQQRSASRPAACRPARRARMGTCRPSDAVANKPLGRVVAPGRSRPALPGASAVCASAPPCRSRRSTRGVVSDS